MPIRSALLWPALLMVLQAAAPMHAATAAVTPDISSVSAGEFDVALDLCSRLAPTDVNIVLGPHVIASGLGMLYAGARGRTETEMALALRFELPRERLHAAFGLIEDSVRSMEARGLVEIELGRLKDIFATADALEGLSSVGRRRPEFKGA